MHKHITTTRVQKGKVARWQWPASAFITLIRCAQKHTPTHPSAQKCKFCVLCWLIFCQECGVLFHFGGRANYSNRAARLAPLEKRPRDKRRPGIAHAKPLTWRASPLAVSQISQTFPSHSDWDEFGRGVFCTKTFKQTDNKNKLPLMNGLRFKFPKTQKANNPIQGHVS